MIPAPAAVWIHRAVQRAPRQRRRVGGCRSTRPCGRCSSMESPAGTGVHSTATAPATMLALSLTRAPEWNRPACILPYNCQADLARSHSPIRTGGSGSLPGWRPLGWPRHACVASVLGTFNSSIVPHRLHPYVAIVSLTRAGWACMLLSNKAPAPGNRSLRSTPWLADCGDAVDRKSAKIPIF